MEETYFGLRNLDHDPELARALGTVLVVWASAENALVSALSTIMNCDWKLARATYIRIPTYEARTKVIRAMICEWKDDRYNDKAIYRAILKLNLLARRRNHWVHGYWAATTAYFFESAASPTKETVIFDYRAPEGAPDRRKLVTAAGVFSHCENVVKRTDQLLELLQAARPGTFPRS